MVAAVVVRRAVVVVAEVVAVAGVVVVVVAVVDVAVAVVGCSLCLTVWSKYKDRVKKNVIIVCRDIFKQILFKEIQRIFKNF